MTITGCNREAVDKEKSSRLEDLLHKLSQEHSAVEMLQGQQLALEQKLKAAEDANKAKEAEIYNLQRAVAQLHVKQDTRYRCTSQLHPFSTIGAQLP